MAKARRSQPRSPPSRPPRARSKGSRSTTARGRAAPLMGSDAVHDPCCCAQPHLLPVMGLLPWSPFARPSLGISLIVAGD